jgi:hypothetical protein
MIAKIDPTRRKMLVLVKGPHRFVYRFTPGSEGTLLASLLGAVRDPRTGLTWADLLPVLVRLRDYILSGGGTPMVVHKIHAAA